jgi:hypothetical protein
MKRSFLTIILVILLAVVGGVLLLAGLFDRRMAIAQEDMAVLDFDDPKADYVVLQQQLERVPWVSARPLEEIRERRALLQYWQRDYGDLVELAKASNSGDGPGNPNLQILAANALYRVAQTGLQDKATVLKNLDAAIRAYADALKSGSDRPDTAFNYELAIKLREEIASNKRKGGLPYEAFDRTPTDSNMHGDEGEPPKETKKDDFQIRIPLDPREMKNSQEEAAGTGQQRRRRG